jgi:hypothetical protein
MIFFGTATGAVVSTVILQYNYLYNGIVAGTV